MLWFVMDKDWRQWETTSLSLTKVKNYVTSSSLRITVPGNQWRHQKVTASGQDSPFHHTKK